MTRQNLKNHLGRQKWRKPLLLEVVRFLVEITRVAPIFPYAASLSIESLPMALVSVSVMVDGSYELANIFPFTFTESVRLVRLMLAAA